MPVLPSLCFFVRRDGFSSPDTPAGKPAAGQKACPTKTRNTGRNACATLLLFFLIAAATKNHATRGYKMTGMPGPARIVGIGDSHLEITTKAAKAQAYFDQGLNLLHCFWDFEAYRAFKEAARLDPNAAMAYWGIVEAISDYSGMEEIKKSALEMAENLENNPCDPLIEYGRSRHV